MAKYPRDLAVRVLTRVLSDREPLDEALAAISGETPADMRGWLQEVCSGTLRWKSRLDMAIDSTAISKKPSGWLRKAMLIAAYQLVVQERTSPAAVVSETVDQVKRKEGQSPAKFINAALRKIADHSAEWKGLEIKSPAAASLPDWMWDRFVKSHGKEWLREFARATLERPTTWILARSEDWKPAFAEPGPIARSWRLTEGGAVPDKAGFAEGEFIVQDISSQTLVAEISSLVAEACGRRDFTALDLCAAPGGKSVGLAWAGARVSASDRDSPRMTLLSQTLSRAKVSVTIVPRAQVAALPEQDLVWVDAPCSGSGIIRRHPDVRWLRQDKDLAPLTELQVKLLEEAWGKVRPGGFLAYSVCSVLREEGADRVASARLEGASPVREWQLHPQNSPFGDGFWAVLLKKPA